MTGARAFEALDDAAAAPEDPALEGLPVEGADPSVEGADLAAVLAAGSAPPATVVAVLAAESAADATVPVAGATDFATVDPADAAPPPEGAGSAAADEFSAGAEAAVDSACVAG